MTIQQFHNKLLKLIKQAHRGGICPACAVREMLAASEAIALLSDMTTEDLRTHGIPTLERLEEVQREHLH